jgi:dTDP-4-amino-4,6-dideoxygalactose transaminase
LQSAGIESLIHYPIPIPRQQAIAATDECPIADRICSEVFSLPLYPTLDRSAIGRVSDALRACAVSAHDG